MNKCFRRLSRGRFRTYSDIQVQSPLLHPAYVITEFNRGAPGEFIAAAEVLTAQEQVRCVIL